MMMMMRMTIRIMKNRKAPTEMPAICPGDKATVTSAQCDTKQKVTCLSLPAIQQLLGRKYMPRSHAIATYI